MNEELQCVIGAAMGVGLAMFIVAGPLNLGERIYNFLKKVTLDAVRRGW